MSINHECTVYLSLNLKKLQIKFTWLPHAENPGASLLIHSKLDGIVSHMPFRGSADFLTELSSWM